MIIHHAGYNEGFVLNARKIHLLSYIKVLKHHNAMKLQEKSKSELRLELTISRVSGEHFYH